MAERQFVFEPDSLVAVRAGQAILSALLASRIPVRLALTELGDCLASDEALTDAFGVLSVWRKVVAGEVKPETRAALPAEFAGIGGRIPKFGETPVTRRERAALRMVGEQGHLTSRELALATGVSPECARMTLSVLVERGELVAVGQCRGRKYASARHQDGTNVREGLSLAAE